MDCPQRKIGITANCSVVFYRCRNIFRSSNYPAGQIAGRQGFINKAIDVINVTIQQIAMVFYVVVFMAKYTAIIKFLKECRLGMLLSGGKVGTPWSGSLRFVNIRSLNHFTRVSSSIFVIIFDIASNIDQGPLHTYYNVCRHDHIYFYIEVRHCSGSSLAEKKWNFMSSSIV